jgi:NAD(P)H-flavin reductase/hemoglobin-like flavoprotein
VAIALDGGVPDYGADRVAGQPRLGIFKRQRDAATPPARASHAPESGATGTAAPETAPAGSAPAGQAAASPAAAVPVTASPLAPGRPGARPRGGAHRAPGRRPGSPGRARPASPPPAPPRPPAPPLAAPAPAADELLAAAPPAAAAAPPAFAPADDGAAGQLAGGRPLASLRGLVTARIAQTESMAEPGPAAGGSPAAADFDANVVQETFACLTANAPLAMEHFYSHLFISSPETRAMFPMEMSQMRDRLFAALSGLVQTLDSPAQSAAYLAELGRAHRKYGVKDKHFAAFFSALLDTVAHFAGRGWTPETETAWSGALEYAARTMRTAAEADARDHPAWWVGEIVAHERRTESVAVLTIAPDQPLPYRAGQYVPVQVPRWPRVWRPYSIANAPRADGLLQLHVRAVPGGLVSADLVRHATVGDTLLLGPAGGEMTAPPPGDDGDLQCIAGGTGLAPIKAIVESALGGGRRGGRPRRITLFVGARRMDDLYDLPDLQAMQAAQPGLQVILVLSGESVLSGRPLLSQEQAAAGLTAVTGPLPGVVLGHRRTGPAQTYLSGPAAMVTQTAQLLAARVPAGQLHYDPPPAEPTFTAGLPGPASAGVPDDFRSSPLFAKFARPGFAPEHAPPELGARA